jgi:L-arginine dehydrogenase
MSSKSPIVLNRKQVQRYLADIDVMDSMRHMFAALAAGQAVQPAQQLTLFPQQQGDFIAYSGVLGPAQVFGAKLSPYLVRPDAPPLVTAWTVLMCMESGEPLLLCDAQQLTVERTAATTALAVDLLARADAKSLAVIGTGPVARAHIRRAARLRLWNEIRVYSPHVAVMTREEREALLALAPGLQLHTHQEDAVRAADVVMLCTSSAEPVLDPATLEKPALITSISTNAFRAHEVAPSTLAGMDVYCDYAATTPNTAGEMVLAISAGQWSARRLCGDLADLVSGSASLPDYSRHAYFRSVGLGLEDVALAYDVLRVHRSAVSNRNWEDGR